MSNLGRAYRRQAEREAARRDGKQRDVLAERRGKGVAVYRAGRTLRVNRGAGS